MIRTNGETGMAGGGARLSPLLVSFPTFFFFVSSLFWDVFLFPDRRPFPRECGSLIFALSRDFTCFAESHLEGGVRQTLLVKGST